MKDAVQTGVLIVAVAAAVVLLSIFFEQFINEHSILGTGSVLPFRKDEDAS